ncbi:MULTISPECIES: hypothetical protein [Sphingobium]|uniref:Uncharacterized protein n=1 Tax=Sphingobium indicum (strain DSM 16413 / CCM 7287 / MTCC 6362 / UT26 / NBRC 101211 / UT26S) TaxID=452662 RepID=D4Z373_SPHIU|nr:hypothetical protein [Sphingobium indicum]BAI97055.1 hypothetical protein SJA_C1-22210 [Sphingobium indicum UT26S]
MRLKPEGRRDERALPRLSHWVMAALALCAIMLVVPVIAGLT